MRDLQIYVICIRFLTASDLDFVENPHTLFDLSQKQPELLQHIRLRRILGQKRTESALTVIRNLAAEMQLFTIPDIIGK